MRYIPASHNALVPPWPLMYVTSHFPYVYEYFHMIYKPDGESLKHKAAKKKGSHKKAKHGKYVSGIEETFKFIQCYNPRIIEELLKCGMPYKTARETVKKMINSI